MDASVAYTTQARSRRDALKRLLNPRSIVFVGGGWVAAGIEYCRQLAFDGPVAVVNPKRESIGGIACAASLDDVPFVPDVAFVCVNKTLAVGLVRKLREKGVTGCVCNAAGFSEIGADGAHMQARLAEAAGDMLVLGPNSPGFVNFQNRAAVMMERFGVQPPGPGVALVTQGGAVMLDLLASDRDLRLTHMVGTGNQMDVSIPECVDIVLDDDHVRAVAVYAEALPDAEALSRVGWRALRSGTPVVMMKVGATDAGARAMRSHTASMTSPEDAVRALLARLGIIQVHSVEEMTETLKMLTIGKRPAGSRTAILTASGMHSAVAGDAAEQAGLDVAHPSAATLRALAEVLPPIATPGNPLDLTTIYWGERDTQAACYKALLADGYDIALNICNYPKTGTWDLAAWEQGLLGFSDAVGQLGVAAASISLFPECFPENAKRMHEELGIAPLQGLGEGMLAVAHAARYHRRRETLLRRAQAHVLVTPTAVASDAKVVALDEHAAKHRLAAAGVPVPESIVVDAGDRPAPPFAGPYAVKLLDDTVQHKTELGAVVLGVERSDAIHTAMDAIRGAVDDARPGFAAARFLVERFVDDALAELCVGVMRSPDVGLTLTLSFGGVLTELVGDSEMVVLPAAREDIVEAFERLAVARLCAGYRGKPPGDRTVLIGALEAVAQLAVADSAHIVELEINPFLIRPEGKGVVAADAVLRVLGC